MLPFNTIHTKYGLLLFRLESYPPDYHQLINQNCLDQTDLKQKIRSIHETTKLRAYTINNDLVATDTPFQINNKYYEGLAVDIQLNTLDDDGRCIYTCTGRDHHFKKYEMTQAARDLLRQELNTPLIKKAREIIQEMKEIKEQQYLTGLIKRAQETINKNQQFIKLVEGVING